MLARYDGTADSVRQAGELQQLDHLPFRQLVNLPYLEIPKVPLSFRCTACYLKLKVLEDFEVVFNRLVVIVTSDSIPLT